jgi:hypothetical protein
MDGLADGAELGAVDGVADGSALGLADGAGLLDGTLLGAELG